MISLDNALGLIEKIIAKQNIKLPVTEVQLGDGLNRVLAMPQFSLLDLPAFNKATMDGYAILDCDKLKSITEYLVLATVGAGSITEQKLRSGTCIKVMTGAPVPHGAEIVVPLEMVKKLENKIKIICWPNVTNIHNLAKDIKKGEQILPRGKFLDPVAIGNLSACGISRVPVYRKLRIAIISTGEEVVTDFAQLTAGKIMDSNGPMLQALCHKYGMEVVMRLQIGDDYEKTITALRQVLTQVDMVLFSGGVSVGDFDFVGWALSAAGLIIHFNQVAIKPGKPITFASASDQAMVFALPGNPLATYLTFHLFVLHAIKNILGTNHAESLYLELPLAKNFKCLSTERTEYVPSKLLANGTLMPLITHGSAHLAILLESSGFFVVPNGISECQKGERVKFLYTTNY